MAPAALRRYPGPGQALVVGDVAKALEQQLEFWGDPAFAGGPRGGAVEVVLVVLLRGAKVRQRQYSGELGRVEVNVLWLYSEVR